jgi:16S rRNA (uracil1498-N3)-methyltransferase
LLCEVRDEARGELALSVIQRTQSRPLPCRITLLQAVPKGRLMESIIEKATELGVGRVAPILSERSVPRLEGEAAAARTEKWRQTAVEAIKQCGNPWLPQIEAPLTPKAFLARGEGFDLPLVASLQEDRRHPRERLEAFVASKGRLPKSVCVWIGPEGDYTPAELSAIKAGGALPISLGPLILRSETAALYCLSILDYELQAGSRPGAG